LRRRSVERRWVEQRSIVWSRHTIDYRWEEKIVEYRGAIGAIIDRSLHPLSENVNHLPTKKNRFSQEMHLEIPLFWAGFEIVKFSPGLMSLDQLFSSWWNCYHQWLSDIKLNQVSVFFFSFLCQDQPLFHCLKENWGLNLLRNSRTPKNYHCHIYSLKRAPPSDDVSSPASPEFAPNTFGWTLVALCRCHTTYDVLSTLPHHPHYYCQLLHDQFRTGVGYNIATLMRVKLVHVLI
jgi:hypothetical protein